jgi:hypothetical protein
VNSGRPSDALISQRGVDVSEPALVWPFRRTPSVHYRRTRSSTGSPRPASLARPAPATRPRGYQLSVFRLADSSHVRLGSEADIAEFICDVRLVPLSGCGQVSSASPTKMMSASPSKTSGSHRRHRSANNSHDAARLDLLEDLDQPPPLDAHAGEADQVRTAVVGTVSNRLNAGRCR